MFDSYPVERLLRLRYPVFGESVPTDQGEGVYASICRHAPQLHALGGLAISPICGGTYVGTRLHLIRQAHLFIQTSQETVAVAVGLAGKTLDVKGASIRLGPANLSLIQPAASLQARFVTMKNACEPEDLAGRLEAHLQELESGGSSVEVLRRRVMTIHGKKVVGFGVRLMNLSESASIALQVDGYGGRRRFGAGFFLPISGVRTNAVV